jgi:hypothetical protein
MGLGMNNNNNKAVLMVRRLLKVNDEYRHHRLE